MLIRYKKNLEKIAMGLLSFMPEQKDVKKLQHTIKEYETDKNWHLYLWKEEEDVLGAIGLKIDNDISVIIQHISVNPSHRNLGIGKKMVQEVKNIYEDRYEISADEEVEQFYYKCLPNDEEKNDQP